MAEKQLKRCDKSDFIFCTTDVCIPKYDNEKVKLSRLFIFWFVLQKEHGQKCGFIQWVLYSKFYLRFAKNSVFDNI